MRTTSMHILVVEDDVDVVAVLRRYFEGQGFRVSAAGDGGAMREALLGEPVDLVLLDLGLPGEDGLDLIRYLRTQWSGAVIVVTGRGDSVDRVVGLELGADDYVTKPFDLRELLARVRSVLRRATPEPQQESGPDGYEFEGFRLEAGSRTLTGPDGATVPLTSGEFELLLAFLQQPQRVLSRDQLMNAVHGRDAGPYDRALDVQVGRLRRKIEADAEHPALIKAVRGAGYVLSARVRRT